MTKLQKRLAELAKVVLADPANRSKKQNVVAVVFDKQGKVFSFGENSFVKSNSRQAQLAKKAGHEPKVFLHAEISAILRWRRFTDNLPYGIFIARMDKAGSLVCAKPCEVCSLAIKELGIKHVFHT